MQEFQYLIPEESHDAMTSHVVVLRKIENRLRDIFTDYHYQEVLLPSFEYVDLYSKMDIGIEEEKMFQFINHEGKRIALRADFTLPLTRLYVSQNKNDIQRYCYFGSVYRKEKRHKGRSTEFYQAGIELMGKGGTAGEKECLEMVQKTISCLGLKEIRIVVGSAKFYKRIIELTDLAIVDILKLRSFSSMRDYIKNKNIQGYLKELLILIVRGIESIKVIDQVISLVEDNILKDALLELKQLYDEIEDKNIYYDLAMTPSMKYYTGIMIKAYTPHVAQPILTGGRYDHLMHHFHKNVPSIGFSYDLHYILNAIEKEEEMND